MQESSCLQKSWVQQNPHLAEHPREVEMYRSGTPHSIAMYGSVSRLAMSGALLLIMVELPLRYAKLLIVDREPLSLSGSSPLLDSVWARTQGICRYS